MALISTLLTPVRARQEFLPDFSIDFKQTDSPDKNSSNHSDEIWTGKNLLDLSLLLLNDRLTIIKGHKVNKMAKMSRLFLFTNKTV
jgi:hypothetical protein